ncbi:MAG: MFS transporter [Planctomycetes bacterium]|nr:MFS transporter [Planctomycetota bacterium]
MAATAQSKVRLPNLLVRNPNFVLLWAAYGISAIGDHLSEMALIHERGGLDRPDVTHIQALLSFGFFLPFVILGPLAGWWADRFSRKWTMVLSDVVRAGVMVGLCYVLINLDDWGWALNDYAIVLPLFLTGMFAAFFSPCRQAILPVLIRDDQLVRANAMISAMGTIGAILSAVIGGKLVDLAIAGHFDIHWNYLLDALTFLFSASLLIFLSLRRSRYVRHARLQGVLTPLRDGFRYVRRHRRTLQLILLGTVFWAAAGVVVSVVPAVVRDVFGGKFSDVGLYRGLIAAGLATGAAVMTLVGPALPLRIGILSGLVGGAAWLFALDAAYVFKLGRLLTGLCLFGIGGAGAALLVTVKATIQRFVPDTHLGRVFGVYDMCVTGAMVATTGAIGLAPIPNLDAYIPVLLGITGIGLALAAWLAWRDYRRSDRYGALLTLLWQTTRFHAAFWMGLKRIGPCTVPREGPVIIAANHTSGADPLLILAASPHRLCGFVVAQEYYHRPLAGWFMRQVDCIPINRANPGKAFLSACLRTLHAGGCLGIFPQGTFVAPDEGEPAAKPGIGVIALRTGATVVPCHISGTTYTRSPFAALFRRHKARVRFGKPIDLSAFHGHERDRDTSQRISELIMTKIWELAPAPEPRAFPIEK